MLFDAREIQSYLDETAIDDAAETIEQKEAALVATLQTVYGTGAINPESGEITPVQQ